MTVIPTRSNHRRAAAGWVVALILAVALVVQHVALDGSTSDGDSGSGVLSSQTRDVPTFSRLDLTGSNRVTVHVGTRPSVVVRGDENLLDHVTTRVRDGTLDIGSVGDIRTKAPMSVDVGVRSLEALTLSGSGIIVAENVHGRRFTLALPGSGVVHISGAVTRLGVTLGGSGDAQLQDLTARDATRDHRGLRSDRAPRHEEPRRVGVGQRRDHVQRQPDAGDVERHGERRRHSRLLGAQAVEHGLEDRLEVAARRHGSWPWPRSCRGSARG